MRSLPLTVLLLFLWTLSSAWADTLIHYTYKPSTTSFYSTAEDVLLSADSGYVFQIQRSFQSMIEILVYRGSPTGSPVCGVSSAPLQNSQFAVGSYPNTAQLPSEIQPGLSFFENNNAATSAGPGEFQVFEVTYDANGNVLTFAANFVLHNPYSNALTRGQIRYNSSVPYIVPGGTAEFADIGHSISERAGSLTVKVNRNGGKIGPLTVNYATADGTDLAGRDYTATSGTLSWTDGDTTDRTITIPILDSKNPLQGNGTFSINLNGTGVGLQSQDTVTIINENSSVTFVHVFYPPDPTTGKATERTFSLDTGYLISAKQSNGLIGPNAYQGAVEFSFDNQAAAGNDDSEFWHLDFSVPLNQSLGVGDYQDARQYPIVSWGDFNHPGLNLFGDGRASDSLTGNFQVLEAEYDAAGNVFKFAANFVEYADDSTQPVRGEVRYNSTVAPLVETPQITAIAVTPQVFADGQTTVIDGQTLLLGIFKIVRTGDTAKPLNVNLQLSGKYVNGQKFGPFSTQTIPIQAGKRSVRLEVGIPAPGASVQVATQKLTLQPSPKGKYTVPNTKPVKIQVIY